MQKKKSIHYIYYFIFNLFILSNLIFILFILIYFYSIYLINLYILSILSYLFLILWRFTSTPTRLGYALNEAILPTYPTYPILSFFYSFRSLFYSFLILLCLPAYLSRQSSICLCLCLSCPFAAVCVACLPIESYPAASFLRTRACVACLPSILSILPVFLPLCLSLSVSFCRLGRFCLCLPVV